jgi:NAD(P)-dependent dehydrogenase (short-subunit alcohol dehydrogenase family)
LQCARHWRWFRHRPRAACRFAAEEAIVVVADRNADAAAEVGDEIRSRGGDAVALTFDQADEESVRQLFLAAGFRDGPDVACVNAAVAASDQAFVDISVGALDRIVSVNVRGAALVAQAAIPLLRRHEDGVVLDCLDVGPPGSSIGCRLWRVEGGIARSQ